MKNLITCLVVSLLSVLNTQADDFIEVSNMHRYVLTWNEGGTEWIAESFESDPWYGKESHCGGFASQESDIQVTDDVSVEFNCYVNQAYGCGGENGVFVEFQLLQARAVDWTWNLNDTSEPLASLLAYAELMGPNGLVDEGVSIAPAGTYQLSVFMHTYGGGGHNSTGTLTGNLLFSPNDCNGNGEDDAIDIKLGYSVDCNGNGYPDECEIDEGTSPDCNENGIPDSCDIIEGSSSDFDSSGIPDDCECLADISLDDDQVNIHDLLSLIAVWGTDSPTGDINYDGSVNVHDLLLLIGAWGACP